LTGGTIINVSHAETAKEGREREREREVATRQGCGDTTATAAALQTPLHQPVLSICQPADSPVSPHMSVASDDNVQKMVDAQMITPVKHLMPAVCIYRLIN